MIHLTAGQQALLTQALALRLHELERRLAQAQTGLSRVDHAQEVLAVGADDAKQHAAEREVTQALSDLELRELTAVGGALQRLRDGEYGQCAQCGVDIPFDRLKIEPWALRCVACESQHEQQHGGRLHRSTL